MASSNGYIDLRSDTVTEPTAAMRSAMASADVGDDVYGEDPTVQRLEQATAERLGMEAGLFVPSGTQSNLLALLTHCQRGDEYIAGQDAHTYKDEGGGAAVFGSIQPQPLDVERDGTLDLRSVAAAIKSNDFHFARTRLLCLENTTAGRVLPLNYLDDVAQLTRERELGLHLDGARLFNATVKLGVAASDVARHFDSVSVCLSKGLGAPVGSVLCGPTAFVSEARRWRKVAGGGMRQSGILAAAGIVALGQHVDRLVQDHQLAQKLAQELSNVEPLGVELDMVQTNMVFAVPGVELAMALQTHLRQRGILISAQERIRLVTHLDVSKEDVARVVAAVKDFFAGRGGECRQNGR